ncbi:hypothetical protein COO60DRAFT_1699907 [Scenedesmus sp. NREL 46B-D3]|nr:hypothetical protein COO60DRAFT_1699907 [Scenedesmus sp. NREL 46B-D3]
MEQVVKPEEEVAAAAEQQPAAVPPLAPVAPVAAGNDPLPAAAAAAAAAAADIPDYPVIIKHPMDLKTARDKVRAGLYNSMDEWRADIKRIWENCRKYNGEDHPVTRCAEKLEAAMERRMEEAVAGAAREVSAAQQRADVGGLAAKGAAAGSRPRAPREVALLRASNTTGSDSDGGEDGKQAGPALRTAARQQHQSSPEPVRPSLKRVASGGNMQVTTGAAAGPGPAAVAAAAAADGRGGPAKRGRLVSTGLNGGSIAAGPAPSAAAGNTTPGVDYDALDQLGDSQAAKQLGTSDADDLAFLAVWKRVVAKRTQAASETDGLRQVARRLKRSLQSSAQEACHLRDKVDEEAAARADAEKQLSELQAKYTQLQDQHKEQHKVLEHQRQLLEQQQQVLRQVLKQQQQSQPAAPPAAPAVPTKQEQEPAAAAAPAPPQAAASQPASPAAEQEAGQQLDAAPPEAPLEADDPMQL